MIEEVKLELVKENIKEYFKCEIPNELIETDYTKIIIYREEKIKGILCYELIYDRIEINYILVFPEYRRHGIAEKLLRQLISMYNYSITLEVRSDNVPAIGLYKKCGFIAATIRKKYYGNIDAILMIKGM